MIRLRFLFLFHTKYGIIETAIIRKESSMDSVVLLKGLNIAISPRAAHIVSAIIFSPFTDLL